MDLVQVRQLPECLGVPEGYEDDTVMSEGGQGREDSRFLTASVTGGGNEDTSVFPVQSTASPQLTGGIPEGLRTIS